MSKSDCNSNGEDLHYSIHGDGEPVVLIHGFAASNNDWVYITPELTNLGYQVIAPDLVGHGNSSKPIDPECYTFHSLYEHFIDWINNFGVERKLTLIGHSLGGSIALNYSFDHPDAINKMVLIDPYYDRKQLNPILGLINHRPDLYHKALAAAPPWLVQTAISLDVRGLLHYEVRTRQQIAEDYKRADPQIAYIPGSIPNISDRIDNVTSPTLVIWGSKDATLHTKSFPTLVDKLPTGFGESIQGAGHQPHLAKPEKFNQLVTDFLKESSSGKGSL
jgi:2-succinyl-6-hydroxy-2,4-cyclohexadiene-1-carboxylate synthase